MSSDVPSLAKIIYERKNASPFVFAGCTKPSTSATLCTYVQVWREWMNITIDTSALIAVVGNEASKQKIIEITTGYSLCAPMSVHWEIGNTFSAMFKRGRSDIAQSQKALTAYRGIPIKFVDLPLERTLEISHTLGIYAYDAYLIQCAQQTSTSLLTLDSGLKVAAKKMGIHLMEVSQ